MTKLTILKLGGSVVTNKETTDYTVRQALLRQTFLQIKRWLEENPEQQLVLVHGAGGHIHDLAHQYELTTTCSNEPEKIQHALQVQDTCLKLHREIVGIGKAEGLALTSVPTHDVITNREGTIETVDITPIINAFANRTIPVLFGDMVADITRELSICSGDAVVVSLSTLLQPHRIIYASDIDGIYTEDPHISQNAQLIEKLAVSRLYSENIKLAESHNLDVTGGLQGKLQKCQNLFKYNPDLESVEIYNGLAADNTKKTLNLESFPHTTITK